MKKSLIALALFASAALSGAASASSFSSQARLEPTNAVFGHEKAKQRSGIPDGDGISRSHLLTARIGGGSGDINGGGSSCQKFSIVSDHGGGSGGQKMDTAMLPTPWGKHQELSAKHGEGLGEQVPKTGQFTVGGQYVAGAHLSPTWEGDLHL